MFSKLTLVSSLALLSLTNASPILQARHAPSDGSRIPTYETESPTSWTDLQSSCLVPIHSSCNVTLRLQLETAIEETFLLAENAKKHLLYWGHESPYVKKYFGNGSTSAPIGWYERVISANKTGMLLRCDDPDGNCAAFPNYYAGHWRGSNATQETVICPLSFQPGRRRSLASVCGLGYTVAASPLNTFWATDLLHRFFHVPKVTEGGIDHYAEDYDSVLELAATNATYAAMDSDALQYFAIDVYAFDIANPGIGCTGEVSPNSPSAVAVAVASVTPSVTASAAQACHTHADGSLHCT